MYTNMSTTLMVIDLILSSLAILSIIAGVVSYNWLKKIGIKPTDYLAISLRKNVEMTLGLGGWKNRLIAVLNIATTVFVVYYALPLTMVAVIVSYALTVIGWMALHKHPAYRLASL